MNIVTRRIVNCFYEHAKPSMLRLCKKSYCTLYIDSTSKRKALIGFQRFPKKYMYSFQHQKCMNLAVKDDDEESCIKSKGPREHELMHSLLQSSVHYVDTIIPHIKTTANVTKEDIEELHNVNWLLQNPTSVLQALKKLTYCHLNGVQFENEIFNNILKACDVKLSEFDDKEILKLMQCLIVLQDFLKESYIYVRFQKNLNKECLKRFYHSNPKELLLIVDAFYQLHAWESDYAWRALRKLGARLQKLSAKELAQFLFFTSLYSVPDLNMFEIQYKLEECLPELTADEIGIAARGFFLTKSRIYNQPLMAKIIKKVRQDISSMKDVTFAASMKLIRYSNCKNCVIELCDLLRALRTEVLRRELVVSTHVVHLAGGQRVYDKPLLDNIFIKIEDNIQSARIKDIERFIYTVCTVTLCTEYQDECNKLVNELISSYKTSRAPEINLYLKPLPRIIVFLTYKNIYPRELIEYIMEPEYVTKAYKHNLNLLTNEFLIINCSLKIELPDYTGPFLDDKIYKYLVKKFCQSTGKSDTKLEGLRVVKLRSEITYMCKEKLGLKPYTDHISPQFITADTVLGFDECNNSISVESTLSAMPFGSIKRVDTDDLKSIQWKVLLLLTSAHKVVGHKGYISRVYAKFRQLKAIGYTPIPISQDTWDSFSTEDGKCNYLRRQIFQESPLTVL